MTDSTTYFGDPIRATYPNGDLIIVNGRPLLIPPNFNLQNEINAAHYAATQLPSSLTLWFKAHYALGSHGDPQRQAGYSGGFDSRYTDAGNYGYGLSSAAAGYTLEQALETAANFNKKGTGRALPAGNESAIRQGFADYIGKRFSEPDHDSGAAYVGSTRLGDSVNTVRTVAGFLHPPERITESDVDRYAKARWGDLNSLDAQAFKRNFQQAFGGYPQHLDIDLLSPLAANGSIPSGKDVSLFVGKNGEVLVYAKPPAPGGTGAFRGIYGLDGAPDGRGSTGMNFFADGTPQPVSVLPHPTTSDDPTGGIDVTLADGSREHWWLDPTDGFLRSRTGQPDPSNSHDTPSERLGHVPGGTPSQSISPSPNNRTLAPSPEDANRFASYQPAPDPTDGSARYLSTRIVDASGTSMLDGVPDFKRSNALLPDDRGSLDNPVLRYIQAAPNVPPTPASFEIPGSYFGRLLTGTAHLAGNDLPSAATESLPLAPEPEPLSRDALHEWLANWIRSSR